MQIILTSETREGAPPMSIIRLEVVYIHILTEIIRASVGMMPTPHDRDSVNAEHVQKLTTLFLLYMYMYFMPIDFISDVKKPQ